jgi:hypothetical protein
MRRFLIIPRGAEVEAIHVSGNQNQYALCYATNEEYKVNGFRVHFDRAFLVIDQEQIA